MNTRKKDGTETIYVGILRRIGAFVYDIILLIAVLFLMTAILLPITKDAISPSNLLFKFYIAAVIFLFFGWFWVHGGQTLGMRAWKIRVELDNGHNLDWPQALLRFIIGVLTFGVGLLWCLWDPRHRALHDVLARTQVVRVIKNYIPPV